MKHILSEIKQYRNTKYKSLINRSFIGDNTSKKKASISIEEVATILIYYHFSGYKNFKVYYNNHVCKYYQRLFRYLPSYSWILRLKYRSFHLLTSFLISKTTNNGKFFIVDSTPLRVCHNKRILNHKVYDKIANRGCSSMGWFFGFKLHAIINEKAEICKIHISKGNIDDRKGLKAMCEGLTGTIVGDKGYLGKKLKEELASKNINLVTNVRKNMKNKPKHTKNEFKILQKRKIVETVFSLLKDKYNLKDFKYRSPISLFIATITSLIAYTTTPIKPKINIDLDP